MFTAPQNVFPRSYQYDLDCVKYRRTRACDALKEKDGKVSLFIFICHFSLSGETADYRSYGNEIIWKL